MGEEHWVAANGTGSSKGLSRIVRFWVASVLLPISLAYGVEPGPRLTVSGGVMKLFGDVAEDFTMGAGGSIGLSYRLEESFSMGGRWITRYWHGVSSAGEDLYSEAHFQGILLETNLVFNPDERTRPMAMMGFGLTWLGWSYDSPLSPGNESNFSFSGAKRRATTFMIGCGAEIDIGERWEMLPSVQVLLNSWSDHTYQGITDKDEDGNIIVPTDAGLLIELSLARRL